MANTGPSLPPTARRLGRGGRAFVHGNGLADLGLANGDFLGNVTAVTWSVAAEQIAVPIPGDWKTHAVAGTETRTGTLRYQDVDDGWRHLLHAWFKSRSADLPSQPPKFDITTTLTGAVQVNDQGVVSAMNSNWVLLGCQIYGYDGGFSVTEDVLEREVQFTFDEELMQNGFYYDRSSTPDAPVFQTYTADAGL